MRERGGRHGKESIEYKYVAIVNINRERKRNVKKDNQFLTFYMKVVIFFAL